MFMQKKGLDGGCMCRPFPYVNAYFLFSSYMPVAGGDGVQVALILRASSFALGFVRRPPSHLGARCTSHLVTHVYAHCPRALSLRWGSLHSVMIKGGGSAVSNGRKNMCDEMIFAFLLCRLARLARQDSRIFSNISGRFSVSCL